MSDTNNNLNIKQLLASIGSKAEEEPAPECHDYDWQKPHYFSTKQLRKLKTFTEKLTNACSRKFARLFHCDFDVTVVSTTQYFSEELLNTEEENSDYLIPFGQDLENNFGLISIPPQSATIWATQLLGGAEQSDQSERGLSQLEESLLLDIAYFLTDAFNDTIYNPSNYNPQLHPAQTIIRNPLVLDLHGTEEMFKITFNIGKSGSEESCEVHFSIFCNKLESVVGKRSQVVETSGNQNFEKIMLDYTNNMPVTIDAQLAQTMFSVNEVMSLQPGDLLIFDRAVNEQIDVFVEGRVFFQGQPAKSTGKYAVAITELCSDG